MRLIVRKERPHPGATLRFTDADRLRLTAFAGTGRIIFVSSVVGETGNIGQANYAAS